MDKIETDCIWVIFKNIAPTFFKFMANRLDEGPFCENHLVCDATIILSEYHFHVLNS